MEVKILDVKYEESATCYLCKVDLVNYIESIPEDYNEYDIQRGIVPNKYLDLMVDTIVQKKHIPPIVLLSNKNNIVEKDGSLKISNFRVLDGLQRTHRFKLISDTFKLMKEDFSQEYIESNASTYYRKNSKRFKSIGSNRNIVEKLFLYLKENNTKPQNIFENNPLWIEVWVGLDENEQIQKMLLLNAGHKPVDIKHQLELLFMGTYIKLDNLAIKGVEFIREKDVPAIRYSKNRSIGQFHFSHIISSLVSLSAGKIVNTNSDFIGNLQASKLNGIELFDNFDLKTLEFVVSFVKKLDLLLEEKFGDVGIKWLGREVVLVGLFGAIGSVLKSKPSMIDIDYDGMYSKLGLLVSHLDLSTFEKERNNVQLNKVNVGNVNKKAVYRAIVDLLECKEFQGWPEYFKG
jgi:hypothetical protein